MQGRSSVAIAQSYSDQLPPASQFQKYEEVCPGAAQTIIDTAVKQSAHRREIEKQVIASGSFESKLGLVFAFIITIYGMFPYIISPVPASPAESRKASASVNVSTYAMYLEVVLAALPALTNIRKFIESLACDTNKLSVVFLNET